MRKWSSLPRGEQLKSDNSGLIARNQANVELEALVQSHNKQDGLLKEIAALRGDLARLSALQADQIRTINAEITALQKHVEAFTKEFKLYGTNTKQYDFRCRVSSYGGSPSGALCEF